MTITMLSFLLEFIKNLEKVPITERLQDPLSRSQQATITRLVTCLVNEKLVSSCIYINRPFDSTSTTSGTIPSENNSTIDDVAVNYNTSRNLDSLPAAFLVVFSKNSTSTLIHSQNQNQNHDSTIFDSISGFNATTSGPVFVFQLAKIPILNKEIMRNFYSIGLMDPEEFGYNYWQIRDINTNIQHQQGSFDLQAAGNYSINDPTLIMRQVGSWLKSDPKIVDQICKELASSIEHQCYRYQNLPPNPDLQKWKSIDWENSIVEGHATHPMHRARSSIIENQEIDVTTDFANTFVKFVAIDRNQVETFGDFEQLISPLLKSAEFSPESNTNTGETRSIYDIVDTTKQLIMPVHILQMPSVSLLFKDKVTVLPFKAKVCGQTSLRTVSNEEMAKVGKCIKLPIAIKITSALRTVTPWSTHVGPKVSMLVPKLVERNQELNKLSGLIFDANVLYIAKEEASANYKTPDFDLGKHISCIVRDEADSLVDAGEKAIICAALTEKLPSGESVVVSSFGLNTVEKRVDFLRNYAELYFAAFVPYITNFGWAFEAHQQNTLVRVSTSSQKVTGFIIRDFGGIKVLQPKMYAALGIQEDPSDPMMLPDASTDAQTIEEVYKLGYHAMIQNNIFRLVRALDLHYSREGWNVVRQALEKCTKDKALLKYWYKPQIDLKCFISMKLDSLYRDYLYTDVSNILLLGKPN